MIHLLVLLLGPFEQSGQRDLVEHLALHGGHILPCLLKDLTAGESGEALLAWLLSSDEPSMTSMTCPSEISWGGFTS
jgi:hypothetical protein